jgi:5-methylcytosine-specific restriction protein A
MTLIRHTPKCAEHTEQWKGPRTASSRVTGQRQWKVLARKILQRDGYQCQIRTEGICTGHATQVDKVVPAARDVKLAYVPSNLRAACAPCNAHKSRTTDRRRT